MPVEMTENLGAYPKLAKTAHRLTGGLSSRVLARKTGLSYDTIQRILKGDRPKADTILKFAAGCRLGESETAELMAAADYGYLTPVRQAPKPKTESELADEGEIERVSDSQEPEAESRLKWMAAYDHLPFKIRESMLAQAEAILEEAYQQRSDIVGKRQK